VDVEPAEDFDVAEGLKDFAVEFRAEVSLAGGAVTEAEPDGEGVDVARLEESRRTRDGNVGSALRRRQGPGGPPGDRVYMAPSNSITATLDVSNHGTSGTYTEKPPWTRSRTTAILFRVALEEALAAHNDLVA